MTGVDNKPVELDPLKREAVGWVQHLTSGKATVADAEALKFWCRQSPAHAAAYAAASRLWKEFGPAAQNLRERGEISSGLAHTHPPQRTLNRRTVLGCGIVVASGAAAYSAIHPPFGLWPSINEMMADYRTETGEQRQVKLAGNVSVSMNTQTSISLRPSEGSADRVELITGEASFTLVPQTQRSLVVLAADGRAIASNAQFDVRRIGLAVCVTCVEGQVHVEQRAGVTAIGSGQQIRYNENGLGAVVSVDPQMVTAWQQGVLIFQLTPLSEVVEEINRYRPGKVILLNAALGRQAVSGRFRIEHIDEILPRLDQAFGVRSRFLPDGIVLLS
jgi:transmembrane sensor